MLAFIIVIIVLILLALLRFGIVVEYGSSGFIIWLRIGFYDLLLTGDDKKPKKEKKKKKPRKKKQKSDRNIKSMLPGSLSEFMDLLRHVSNMLSRFKRRLLIKKLIIYYLAAGDDPASTAIKYGAANTVFNIIMQIIDIHFRVKRIDLNAKVDFTTVAQRVYVNAVISIAVWEVFYAVFALFPILTSALKRRPGKQQINKNDTSESLNGKEVKKDGKSPD